MMMVPGRAAWDELTGVHRDLPTLPKLPRRHHLRRSLVIAASVAAALALGVSGASLWARQAALTASQDVLSGDPARMGADIDRQALQADLREHLGQMARLVSAGQPLANVTGESEIAYLAGLIEITVQGQARPELLARTLRIRAFGSDWGDASPPPQVFMLGTSKPSLQQGGVVLIDLPGDRQAFPSGIGLCFRLHLAAPPTLKLSTLIWPELRNPC
jgi:hypothetical protein